MVTIQNYWYFGTLNYENISHEKSSTSDFLVPFSIFSQVDGIVTDVATKEPIWRKIVASSGQKTLSDLDGKFNLTVSEFPVNVIVTAQGYFNDTLTIAERGTLNVQLNSEVQEIKTVVVTAGRRDQDIENVAISMEIIRPELVDNKCLVDLEQAVNQSPGVFAMDGQVSIRRKRFCLWGRKSCTTFVEWYSHYFRRCRRRKV